MMPFRPPFRRSSRQAGMSLIEVMVGLVIGLLTIVIIYQVYGVSEQYKRNTSSAGDAQTTGMFATFLLSQLLGNGGAAISVNGVALEPCPNRTLPISTRALSVVINPGMTGGFSDPLVPDVVTVTSGAPRSLTTAVMVRNNVAAGGDYIVQSPLGFHVGDMIVAVPTSVPGAGDCVRSTVTAVSAPDSQGIVDITHTVIGVASPMLSGSQLVNLGAAVNVTRTQFDVDPATNTLRSTELWVAGATPNPLASNIVVFKAQYGVDANDDGIIEDGEWVDGVTLSPAMLLDPAQTNRIALNRIRAVRIGMVIRSDQYDARPNPSLTPGLKGQPYTWNLFNWPCVGRGTCPGVALTGTILADPLGGYRYRVYETVIPIRNNIMNPNPT
jgi:type IV pilus assembly protein PilW